MDSNLCQLQAVTLGERKRNVEVSYRMLGLVSEIESAGHQVSSVEQKRALIRRLPKDFDVTAETIMIVNYSYYEAVAEPIVREIRIQDLEEALNRAMISIYESSTKTWHVYRKSAHLAKNSWHRTLENKNLENKGSDKNNPRTCFKCGKPGRIS